MQTSSPEKTSRAIQERRALQRMLLAQAEADNWCALRTGKGESATAQVLDITTEGCRLAIAANPGAICLARLEFGDWLEFQDWNCTEWQTPLKGLRAEVVWVEGRELGCRFERRLAVSELQGGAGWAAAPA